jgi:Family of unknown function (DUF6402)
MDITKIPGIMRFHGWIAGASLLDTWFSRAASTAPSYSTPHMLLTMAFVTKFQRAKDVFEQAIVDKVWVNAAAMKEIADRLRTKGLLAPSSVTSFGDLSKSADIVDKEYVNFRAVDSGKSIDSLTASLGAFTFHFAVEGSVGPSSTLGKTRVEVKKAGIYVVDSFDFNDLPAEDQFLGYWDDSDNTVSLWNPLTGDSVHNSDFRNWRTKNSLGGDFMVYTDIHVIALTPPAVFEV